MKFGVMGSSFFRGLASQGPLSAPDYRPDIDGLRALAVLSVVGFHVAPTFITGGFIGVDIFFVISGFLITRIIFESLKLGSFSFIEFYMRRILRIFPALFLVLLTTFLCGWFFLLADEYKQLGLHVAGGSAFISNFILWSESGYFDINTDIKPLMHLWSLGIEEQFYIIYPLLAWLVFKGRFGFFSITVILFAISFYLNINGIKTDGVATFFSPLTRFWELLCGSIIYLMTYRKPQFYKNDKFLNIISSVGLSLFIFGLFCINKDRAFPGLWALIPTIAAMLIILAGPTSWLNRRLLSNRIAVWFGLISFPLYLWHWPLLSYANIIEGKIPGRGIRLLLVVISIIMAWLTYRFLECRIRIQSKYPLRVKSSILLVLMGLIGCAGCVAYYKEGFEFREFHKSYEHIVNAKRDWWPVEDDPGEKNIKKVLSSPDKYTIMLGDSHAEQYYSRTLYLKGVSGQKSNSVIFLSKLGCPPFDEIKHPDENRELSLKSCAENRRSKFREIIARDFNVSDVVIAFCWACYLSNDFIGVESSSSSRYYYFNNGSKILMNDPRSVEFLLPKLIEEVKRHFKDGVRVWILIDNPIGENFRPEKRLPLKHKTSDSTDLMGMVKVSEGQLILRAKMFEIARNTGVKVIDPFQILCDGSMCMTQNHDGIPIYKDADHLRASFLYWHGSFIDQALGWNISNVSR